MRRMPHCSHWHSVAVIEQADWSWKPVCQALSNLIPSQKNLKTPELVAARNLYTFHAHVLPFHFSTLAALATFIGFPVIQKLIRRAGCPPSELTSSNQHDIIYIMTSAWISKRSEVQAPKIVVRVCHAVTTHSVKIAWTDMNPMHGLCWYF